jgi:transcription antitermination factor NusG
MVLSVRAENRPNGTEMAAACLHGAGGNEVSIYSDSRASWRTDEVSIGVVLPKSGSSWYAIRVRPRWEKLVASALHGKDYDEFVPLYRKQSRWSDRVKEIDLPLFPGYVFCRSGLSGRPPLITTPGVIGILSFGGSPAIISDEEIEAIKTVVDSSVSAGPWPYLHEGRRVRIHRGALTGVEGLLVRVKNDWRVVLSVEVLCRSVAVEIDRDWATPI